MLSGMGFQNIVEGRGVAISIAGMLIVFLSLGVISAFIGCLPKLLALLHRWLPEETEGHGHAPTEALDEAVVAAVGYVMHRRQLGAD